MKQLIHTALLTVLGAALAHADAVIDWNSEALKAIRTDRTAPPRASRNLAILHIAIHDSVNGIKQPHERKYESYLIKKHTKNKASEEAAIAAAARVILSAQYPAQVGNFDAAYAAALDLVPGGSKKERDRDRTKHINEGVAWGSFVANAVLASRANDGSTNVVPAPGGTGPGQWVPTQPGLLGYALPQWGFVRPFAMSSTSQFRPPAPPALDSAEWAAEYNEVKALGAAVNSTRTPEQSQIALFWADGGGTETPPGHWNHIAQDVSAVRGNSLDENARLFALLNIAMADAAIAAWDCKYQFNFWRPITAIRAGDTDGNDATEADPAWASFIITPPFPDHVSGHSTFSGAASTVLALFYGTDDVPFTTGSNFLPGVTRSFPSFSAAAAEAADSRLYGGIHFRSANEDGLNAGLGIGAWVIDNILEPKGGHGH